MKSQTLQRLIEQVRQSPTDVNAWLVLADILEDVEKKKECYLQVLKLDPTNSVAQEKLNRINTTSINASSTDADSQSVNDKISGDCQIGVQWLSETYQVILDYSIRSLKDVDAIGDKARHAYDRDGNEGNLRMVFIYLSLYFGEIIRKHIGGTWIDSEKIQKQFNTIGTTALLLQNKIVDPFEVFITLFQAERIMAVDAFSQIAESFGKQDILAVLESSDMAWICPKCKGRNMTSIRLRNRAVITCPSCHAQYLCITGEVLWRQRHVERHFLDRWIDWSVRIKQTDRNFVEVAFTLRNPDFTIAKNDFLVALIAKHRNNKKKVVYVENKSTGTVIFPGK